MSQCQWFRWIGGRCCDDCGADPDAHEGLRWAEGPKVAFGASKEVLVPWAEYGPGKRLNVPLLTLMLPPAMTPGDGVEGREWHSGVSPTHGGLSKHRGPKEGCPAPDCMP